MLEIKVDMSIPFSIISLCAPVPMKEIFRAQSASAETLVAALIGKESKITYSESKPQSPSSKNDRLIRANLKNSKLNVELDLFYILVGGRTNVSSIRVEIQQKIKGFSRSIMIGWVSPHSYSDLSISEIRGKMVAAKRMPIKKIEETILYNRLQEILFKILK